MSNSEDGHEKKFVPWLLSQHVLGRDDPIGSLATDLWGVLFYGSRPIPRIDQLDDVKAWIGNEVGVCEAARQAAEDAWVEFENYCQEIWE